MEIMTKDILTGAMAPPPEPTLQTRPNIGAKHFSMGAAVRAMAPPPDSMGAAVRAMAPPPEPTLQTRPNIGAKHFSTGALRQSFNKWKSTERPTSTERPRPMRAAGAAAAPPQHPGAAYARHPLTSNITPVNTGWTGPQKAFAFLVSVLALTTIGYGIHKVRKGDITLPTRKEMKLSPARHCFWPVIICITVFINIRANAALFKC